MDAWIFIRATGCFSILLCRAGKSPLILFFWWVDMSRLKYDDEIIVFLANSTLQITDLEVCIINWIGTWTWGSGQAVGGRREWFVPLDWYLCNHLISQFFLKWKFIYFFDIILLRPLTYTHTGREFKCWGMAGGVFLSMLNFRSVLLLGLLSLSRFE